MLLADERHTVPLQVSEWINAVAFQERQQFVRTVLHLELQLCFRNSYAKSQVVDFAVQRKCGRAAAGAKLVAFSFHHFQQPFDRQAVG